MQLVINRKEMKAIVEAVNNSMELDDLAEDKMLACNTLQVFFYELLYGANIEQAIEKVCGVEAANDYREEILLGAQS